MSDLIDKRDFVTLRRDYYKEVLDKLKAKDAEIERLRSKCNQRRDDIKQARDILDERYAEIERLRTENAAIKQDYPEGYKWLVRMNAKVAKLQAVVDAAISWANTDQNDIDGCDKTTLELLDAVTEYEMSVAALDTVDEKGETCEWSDDDGWQSGCGKEWEFIYDGPDENGLDFCMFCGKQITVTTKQESE